MFNFKLNGKRVGLKKYCSAKGLSYNSILNYRRYHNISIEEAVKAYEDNKIDNRGKGHKFLYGGKELTLREYCEVMGYNYKTIVSMKTHLKFSYEEIFKIYKPNEKIKGLSVKEYCKENDINYTGLVAFKNKWDMTYEQAIKIYKSQPKREKKNTGGLTLKEYCKRNNINYGWLYREKEKTGETINEILERIKS